MQLDASSHIFIVEIEGNLHMSAGTDVVKLGQERLGIAALGYATTYEYCQALVLGLL